MTHAVALGSRTLAYRWAGVRARYLLLGAALLIGIVQILTAFEGAARLGIRIGTIELYLFDLLALALGGVGAVLMLRRRRFTVNDVLFLVILGLSLVQFIRGSATFGTQAGIEFRQDAFVLGGLLFMMGTSAHYTHTRRDFMTIIGIYAGAGLLIYAIRALGLASLSEFDLAYNLGTWRAHRFIGADEALGAFGLALACFSMALYDSQARRGPRSDTTMRYWVFGAIALLLAFFAMHRSVWAVVLVALPFFFSLQNRYRLLGPKGFEIVVIGGFVLFFLIALALLTSATFQSAVSEVSQRTGTLNWRNEGWRSLLALMAPADYIIGRGYGADYTRWVLDQFIKNSAHSFYIGKLWQHGIVGLILYLVFYGRVFAGLSRIAKRPVELEDRALATLLMSLLVGELVFFVVYANWIPSVIVLGYALGFVRASETGARQLQQPVTPATRRYF